MLANDCTFERPAEMTKRQIKTITCGLFHEGIEVNKLSAKAKAELRNAVETLLEVREARKP